MLNVKCSSVEKVSLKLEVICGLWPSHFLTDPRTNTPYLNDRNFFFLEKQKKMKPNPFYVFGTGPWSWLFVEG
jgi:hypothetical protein